MQCSQGMFIEEFLNTEYVEKVAIMPEKFRQTDGDEFLIWKGGRVPGRHMFLLKNFKLAIYFQILLLIQCHINNNMQNS